MWQSTPEDAMASEDNNKVTLLASVVAAVMHNLETVEAGMYRTPHACETWRGVSVGSITCNIDFVLCNSIVLFAWLMWYFSG